jgi:hypothetical protein
MARRAPTAESACTTFRWAPYGTVGVWHDNCYDYAFGMNNPHSPGRMTPGNYSGYSPYTLNSTSCAGFAQRILADYKGMVYRLTNPNAPVRPGYFKVMSFIAPKAPDFHFYRQIRHVVYKTRARGNKSLLGKNHTQLDTVEGLAKFFRVTQATIRAAYAKSRPARSANDGRIAMNSNQNLRLLNAFEQKPDPDGTLRPGRVMVIPVNLWAHKQGLGGGPVIVDASGRTIKDPRKADRNYGGLNYTTFCSAYAVKCGAGELVRARVQRARRVSANRGLGVRARVIRSPLLRR